MSYLTLAKGIPNFSKAVISLWFRVPKESAVKKRTIPSEGVDPFNFTIPLIVFGKSQQRQTFHYLFGEVSSDPVHHPLSAYYGWTTVDEPPPFDVGPSWIGVLPNGDDSGTFDMEFNLQFDTYGTYAALGWVVDPPAVSQISADGSHFVYVVTPTDISPTILYGPPEFFYVFTGTSSFSLRFKPDVWHHLLLSFDLTGTVSLGQPFAKSDCRLWYAIDDKDYRGPENLQPNRDMPDPFHYPAGDDLDSNAVLTDNMYNNSGPSIYHGNYLGTPVPEPSGNYTPSPLPSKDQAFGIPGTPTYVQDIFKVEMAEFQMWTGVTLDTGVKSNRRAFVDEHGKPVSPTKPENPDDPDDQRSAAEKLLGKKPEVLLHGSSNWKTGYNTGTTGIRIETVDGKDTVVKIPDGQFTPTAKIEQYKPDPSLETSP